MTFQKPMCSEATNTTYGQQPLKKGMLAPKHTESVMDMPRECMVSIERVSRSGSLTVKSFGLFMQCKHERSQIQSIDIGK